MTFTFATGKGPYSLGVSPDGSNLYVSNISAGTVSVFNTTSKALVTTIPVKSDLGGLAVRPDGSQVYVVSGPGVSVIDTSSNKVSRTIHYPTKDYMAPLWVQFTPDGKDAYVLNVKGVTLIDAVTQKITHRFIGIDRQSEATGMALCPLQNQLYVTDFADVSIINTTTNKFESLTQLNQTYFLGRPAVTPSGKTLYLPITEVFDKNQYEPFNQVITLATGTLQIEGNPIVVGSEPVALGIAPDGMHAYVINKQDNTVSVISISGG